jgi:hypothetical protein
MTKSAVALQEPLADLLLTTWSSVSHTAVQVLPLTSIMREYAIVASGARPGLVEAARYMRERCSCLISTAPPKHRQYGPFSALSFLASAPDSDALTPELGAGGNTSVAGADTTSFFPKPPTVRSGALTLGVAAAPPAPPNARSLQLISLPGLWPSAAPLAKCDPRRSRLPEPLVALFEGERPADCGERSGSAAASSVMGVGRLRGIARADVVDRAGDGDGRGIDIEASQSVGGRGEVRRDIWGGDDVGVLCPYQGICYLFYV